MKCLLESIKTKEGCSLAFLKSEAGSPVEEILSIPYPVILETWDDSADPEVNSCFLKYAKICRNGESLIGECLFENQSFGSCKVVDHWWKVDDLSWQVDRKIEIKNTKADSQLGLRSRFEFLLAFKEGTEFTDLRYFAPPIFYDHNDLDGDGIPDYLPSQNLVFREDRLNLLSVMFYHEKRKLAVVLARADVPEFDAYPVRPNRERRFFQKTDIGSIGFNPQKKHIPQVILQAFYPFYEGEKSFALLNEERPSWEAFWPVPSNGSETLTVSYKISVFNANDFHSALWCNIKQRKLDLKPRKVELPVSVDDLVRLRLEALDRYYVELDASEDPRKPAGFVLNCHPQDGVQLSNIIQYGFTGQTILNAYNYLRYGYATNDQSWIRKAYRTIDFFVKHIYIPESGMFYNLYNVDRKEVDFWWTGLLLPLAYAEPGESLEKLMGPIYHHWKEVIEVLEQSKGSYLRCMSEEAFALMVAYKYELSKGKDHVEWLNVAKGFGEFLLRTQEPDGSWYRAYTLDGNKLTKPEIWFGTVPCEQKSSSATPIPFLVELYDVTQDRRFLGAACKAGKFVRENLVDTVKFNGGIHDSMYNKGCLIDNEGILYPMLGLLKLYKEIGGEYFYQGTLNAARLFLSWICLWDIPLPSESTLAKYGFRTTGMGACDVCGAGYVHPFQLMVVPEIIEIAEMAREEEMLELAELIFHGCNQTVSTPKNSWGYKYFGLQEEGYLSSWLLIDDPVFMDTQFGHRLKGEGNKTCFPWIPAVAVYAYWKMLDNWGTVDFDLIRKKLFRRF